MVEAIFLSWLYVFKGNNALKNLFCTRRSYYATVVSTFRLIYDYKREIFWTIRGEKTHERGYVFSRGYVPVFKFLCRTSLTAYLCKLCYIKSKKPYE